MLGFVGGHFLLSFPPVRNRLITRTGEPAFLVLYSILALVFLAGAIWAYEKAPQTPLWDLGAAVRLAPVLVMPVALVLIVLGLFSRNVTAVGGERLVRSGAPIAGIATITRHPFLWGVALWALAHLAANGDLPSLLLFGGMAILALGGMPARYRRQAGRAPGRGLERTRPVHVPHPVSGGLAGANVRRLARYRPDAARRGSCALRLPSGYAPDFLRGSCTALSRVPLKPCLRRRMPSI
jgi:uncharacterized membrane protein